MTDDPLAPKNLDLAFGKIKSAIDLKQSQRNGHNPKPGKEPNRVCSICTKLWYHEQVMLSPDLIPKPCPDCAKQLDEGMIAITCVDGRFAFVYSAHLAGEEQIQQVSPEVMDKVQEKFKQDQQPPSTSTQNN